LLQSIKEGFDKDLIPNTKRIEPSESELNWWIKESLL
jgi:hypothetical protein